MKSNEIKSSKEPRAFKVFAIEEGTVIDHIDAGHALKIVTILNLASESKIVSLGLNFPSKTLTLKDIIKVEKRELTEEEINRIAIFAPQATINIIRDYNIVKKFKAKIPANIEYVVVCPNPKCITNNEPMTTIFHTHQEKNAVFLQCHYCEKTFSLNEINTYHT